jgi:hypothetical protein
VKRISEECLLKTQTGSNAQSVNEKYAGFASNYIHIIGRGISHNGKLCPQRLEEIKGALQDERIGCCPECLEIFMKNEGC